MAMALWAPLLLFIFKKIILVVANVGWRCVCRRVSGGGGGKFLLVVVSRVMAMATASVFFVCGRVWGWFKTYGACSLSTVYEIFSKSNDGIGPQTPLPSPSLFFSFFPSLSVLSLCLFAKASRVGAWFFPHGFCFQFWGFFTWVVIDDSRTFSLSSHLHPSSRLLLLIFFVFLSWKCVLRSSSKTQLFFLFFSHLPLLFSFFFIFYSLSSSNIFSFMLSVDLFLKWCADHVADLHLFLQPVPLLWWWF